MRDIENCNHGLLLKHEMTTLRCTDGTENEEVILEQEKQKGKRLLPLFAVRTGLEPATPCVTGRYSNQLNYRTSFSTVIPSFDGRAKIDEFSILANRLSRKNFWA